MTKSSLRPVETARLGAASSRSFVRFTPSGVISKAQAMTSAMGKPTARRMRTVFPSQTGRSSMGVTTPMT